MAFLTKPISLNYKLVRELGGARLVHAKGCYIIQDYDERGLEEIPTFKPEKMIPCKHCEKLIYIAGAAEDYQKNYRKYSKVFRDVSVSLVRTLFGSNKKAQCTFVGNRLYILYGKDCWYLDLTLFPLNEVHLFHNNYNTTKRSKGDSKWFKTGFHEHTLPNQQMSVMECVRRIIGYDYGKAKHAHKERQKELRRTSHTMSELDAEYWGFSSEEPSRKKI